MRSFIFIAAVVVSFANATAQQLYTNAPDYRAFPTIEAKIYVFDSLGRLIRPLSASDFIVHEDNIQRNATLVYCPPATPEPISAVLMLDVSSSMNEPTGATRLDMAKSSAVAFIEALSDGVNECAIGSFDDVSYINQDFTSDKSALLSAVADLKPLLGTNYDEALLNPPSGALEIAKTGKYKKIVVFLTDGLGEGNEQAIVARAKSIGATIYCITAGLPMPDILRNISSKSGGECFENITSKTEAIAIFRAILQQSIGVQPCILRWQSDFGCNDSLRICDISVPALALSARTYYTPPPNYVARLIANPDEISFGEVVPNTIITKEFTLTAQGKAITIRNISSSFPSFSLQPPPSFPFTITAGNSRKFTVQFAPADSFFRSADLKIETDLCPAEVFLTGGFTGKFPIPPDINLIRPNGSEKFIVGNIEQLSWKGVTPQDSVRLDYSLDNGETWNFIADAAGLRHNWRIPNTPSDSCIARVTHSAGNIKSNKAVKVLTLAAHTNTVQCASWVPDGSMRAATASSDGTAIIWNIRNGTQIAVCTGHTGTIRHVEFSADGTRLITGGTDGTARIWNTADATQTQILLGHTAPVWAATLSPDGRFALTGCDDGTIRLWNTAMESTTKILTGHTNRAYSVKFSPNGTSAISAGGDRSVRIWNLTNGNEIPPAFNLHENSVRTCSFSPDGRKAASGGSDNVVYIWDTSNRLPIYNLTGHTAAVLSLAWSSDGTRLLTGGEDGRVIVWDALTGTQSLTLPPYPDAVTSVGWNKTGDTIIVAGGNTADIWAIRTTSSQQDESNATWSIVRPTLNAGNADFGNAVIGAIKDSILHQVLINPGNYTAEITGMAIIGTDKSDFSVISGGTPFSLEAGRSHSAEIRFCPQAAGLRNASLMFFTSYGDTLQCPLSGIGVQPAIVLETPLIDFGVVEIGQTKDTAVTVIVRNLGATAVILTPTKQLGPDTSHFSIVNPLPFLLQPNGIHPLILRFKPTEIGRVSGRFGLEYKDIGSPALVRLFGQGLGGIVSLPQDSAFAGERRSFALMLSGIKPATVQGGAVPARFAAEIEYDGSLLFCEKSAYSPKRFMKNGALREHLFINESWDGTSPELAKIPIIATLGSAETTPLAITSFVWLSASGDTLPVYSEKRSGKFKLLGLCETNDGKRFYRPEGMTALSAAFFNGQNATIDFTAGETGTYSIEIFDAIGRLAIQETFFIENIGEIHRELSCSINTATVNFIVLRSPTTSLFAPFFLR